MQDFTLPANIKQIGSIGDGIRIYMEDYVCTFLHQYAEGAGFEERLAFLVGKQMVIDGQQFLFISGAIYGKYAEKHEGHMRFSEKSVDYAEEMLDEHFSGMEIVGWMQSQPSYGTYLNQFYAGYHLRQFRKAHQVMFVVDPLERTNAFYVANPVAMTPADRVVEIPGYFIYYEKNTNMHEYMLVNKTQGYTAKPPTMVELKPMEYAEPPEEESPVTGYHDYFPKEEQPRFSMSGRKDREPEEKIRRHTAEKNKRRGFAMEQKRAVNLLAGLCAVLFVISFIMGVGLVRNQDRVDHLEAQLNQMTIALRDTALNEAAPVFAGDVPQLPPIEYAGITEIIPVYQPEYVAATPTPAPIATPEPAPPMPVATPVPIVTPAPIAPTPAVTDQAVLVAPIPETYTIQPGDSLLAIALYFFADANMVNDILVLNGLENPDHIVAGRTIALPPRR